MWLQDAADTYHAGEPPHVALRATCIFRDPRTNATRFHRIHHSKQLYTTLNSSALGAFTKH